MAPSDLYRLKSLTQAPLYSTTCLNSISSKLPKNSLSVEELPAGPWARRGHISSRPESSLNLQSRRWSVNTELHHILANNRGRDELERIAIAYTGEPSRLA